MKKLVCLLFLAGVVCGCAKTGESGLPPRHDQRNVLEKAHDDIMALDQKIRDRMW